MKLKTRCIAAATLALAVVVPGSAHAQHAGVKAGLTFATIAIPDTIDFDTDWRAGLAGGLYVQSAERRGFSLMVEALVNVKGVEPAPDADSARLTYLQAPVLIRFSPSAGASLPMHLFGGAAIARKVRASYVRGGATEDIEDVKPWDYSLIGGVGIARGRFVADVRYDHGLTALLDLPESDPGYVELKNRAITLMAGFQWR